MDLDVFSNRLKVVKFMKNVILFKSNDVSHNSLNYWEELLKDSFEKLNIRCNEINLDAWELDYKVPQILLQNEIDAAFVFNSYGQEIISENGENVWDKYNVPFFNYCIDHPLEHADIFKSPNKNRNFNVICIDKGHVQFVEKYYKNVNKVFFLPLMGFSETNFDDEIDYDSYIAREYDFSVTMGLYPTCLLIEDIANMPKDTQEYIFEWVEFMECNLDKSPEACLLDMLENKFGKENVSDELYLMVAEKCAIAIIYFRTAIRERIIENLLKNKIEFNLFGNGWDIYKATYSSNRAIFHGEISIDKTAEVYRKTKLGLNILPLFKQGAHDRIATAQLNGAAVLSDSNKYIQEFYSSDSRPKIAFYSMNSIDNISDIVSEVMSDKKKLFEIARNGQRIAKDYLTWDVSARKIIDFVNEVKS